MQDDSKMPKQVYFGFLPYADGLEFDGGVIEPVQEYHKLRDFIDKRLHKDGFLYPPRTRQVILDTETKETVEDIPNTERPALLHKIPSSHQLNLCISDTMENIQKGPGSFIIHLPGYLFQIRLQFHNWWFDKRVPIKSHRSFDFNPAIAEDFVSHCYKMWRGWNCTAPH